MTAAAAMKDDKAMRFDIAVLGAAFLLSAASCSKSTPTDVPAATIPPPAAASAAAQSGEISGKAAPGAVVILESKTPREFPAGYKPVMDQVSLTFTPEMLFVRTGQPVEFRNSDDTLHNVHVGNEDTREPAFN